MRARTMRETSQERRELAADAGFGPFSFMSVVAGVLVAYGAFAILLGLAGAVAGAANADTDLSTDWEQLGTAGGLVVAGLLFLSYLLGGYVAGRMARRNGLAHGAGVLLLGVVLVAAVAALVRATGGVDSIAANLRSLGIPTTADEYGHAGTIAGIASLIALAAGSLLGGFLGERWHARLFARAIDPTVGAQARAARQAEEARTQADLAATRSEVRARHHERDRERSRLPGGDEEGDGDRRLPVEDKRDVDGDRPSTQGDSDDSNADNSNADNSNSDDGNSGNGHRRLIRRR